jgi:DNA-binding response OmpR family regulator
MPEGNVSNPGRILIVDDDEAAIFGYTRYLSRSGFTVNASGDLAEGLEKLSVGEFDAVVLDVRLPDGNSIDVIPTVRAKNKALKIFIVSGLSDPSVRQAALEAGADEYLTKPLSTEELCASICRSLAPKG